MAILPKMTAGATWTGPVLFDDETAGALASALGDRAKAAAREYMRTGVWPAAVVLPEGASRFTLRTLSAAEAIEATDAAGPEPQAWGWYQREVREAVTAEVDAVFLPMGTPPAPDAKGVVPYPLIEQGETPDAPAYVARVAGWHKARAEMVARITHRAIALASTEALDAMAAHSAWQTRCAIERVSRALVDAQPAWGSPSEYQSAAHWRAGLLDFGVSRDGGGPGAQLARELDAHLSREGGRRPKA